MKCHDFELRIHDLIQRDPANPHDQALLDHVQDCSDCEQRLQEEQQLQSQMTRLAEHYQQVSPSDQVREQLGQLVRAQTLALGHQEEPDRVDRAPHWLLIAATLVLGVAAGWLYQSTSRAIPSKIASVPKQTAPLQAPRLEPSRTARESQVAESMYSEFIPIGNCRSMDCLDQAHMMRIDLPRSSVAYFGISKTRIRSRGDRIAADVLVGDDGIARAIRFVY